MQETSLLTLWAKTVENRRPNPLVYSPQADDVAAGLEYDFDKFAVPAYALAQIALCVRARLLDDWVQQFLQRCPAGTVIEIGAGLDARFERLDNGQLTWFDLDLPAVAALRRRFFSPGPRRHLLDTSVLEHSWLNVVRASSPGPYLIVAEGVLPYLPESDVRRLFGTLANELPGVAITFDVYAPWLLELTRWTVLSHFSVRLMWGVSNLSHFQGWDRRYRLTKASGFSNLPVCYRNRFPWLVQQLGENIDCLDQSVRLLQLQLG